MSLDTGKAREILRQNLKKLAEELLLDTVQEMKSRAPVGSRHYEDKTGGIHPGYLKANIGGNVDDNGEIIGLNFWSKAPYSVFMEHGTSKIAPHPFFFGPAEKANRTIASWGRGVL